MIYNQATSCVRHASAIPTISAAGAVISDSSGADGDLVIFRLLGYPFQLGFVGVDTGKYGRLSFGKQNSTHYDISSYTTDRFNVFGGQSTATYVAGTDGGQSGTGRADQTVLYHVKFAKIFDLGGQGQLRTAPTAQAFNGFGFSLQAQLLPNLRIGGAYNKTYFSIADTNLFFHGGGTDYWIVG